LRAASHLQELYGVSRQLASVVVPHEYGLDGPGKLLIGSKICAELLGKLLCDLDSMKVRGWGGRLGSHAAAAVAGCVGLGAVDVSFWLGLGCCICCAVLLGLSLSAAVV
jgi:hypothetical protein